ncbi:MAG: hypothetical protein J5679_01635 [Alphaproteobacteria bacterium]|nr:hypothetical protein [Alphaproteobacteria bacterium]
MADDKFLAGSAKLLVKRINEGSVKVFRADGKDSLLDVSTGNKVAEFDFAYTEAGNLNATLFDAEGKKSWVVFPPEYAKEISVAMTSLRKKQHAAEQQVILNSTKSRVA